MELTVECGNVILHDGAIAAGALWCEHVEVVVTAVGLAVAFMEAVVAELLAALGAEEVLGVPGLFECGDAFLSGRRKKTLGNWKCPKTLREKLHPKSVRCSRHIAG